MSDVEALTIEITIGEKTEERGVIGFEMSNERRENPLTVKLGNGDRISLSRKMAEPILEAIQTVEE
jgi:hypothetical protein